MANTGIVRRVDDLGRIVIPMELRRTLGIKIKDPLEIHVEGDRVVLMKYKDSCRLCGTTDGELIEVKDGVKICTSCRNDVISK